MLRTFILPVAWVFATVSAAFAQDGIKGRRTDKRVSVDSAPPIRPNS